MKPPNPWPITLLSGLLLGVVLGLAYTWTIEPTQYYDTTPDRLRADLKREYVLLISETYAVDNDLRAAQERLADLGDQNMAQTVLELAEEAIAEGQSVATVRHLATLAVRLGATSPAVTAFVPDSSLPETGRPVIALATFTPAPTPTSTATPVETPTPSATLAPSPTPTPRATATPVLHYRLLAQQLICDAGRDEPLLQIVVRDPTGDPISGVEILVTWGEETARLFTGLKPELGLGYADLVIEPEVKYTVRLAAGSEEASGIHPLPCNSSGGPRLLSTRLVFERVTP